MAYILEERYIELEISTLEKRPRPNGREYERDMIYRKNTKELLAESILELAGTKSVDKITIKEITENCGMTSPTFYNHFKDKYDLIAWIYIGHADEIVSAYIDGNMTWKETVYEVLDFMESRHDFYRNAIKNTNGQNSFIAAVRTYSEDVMRNILNGKTNRPITEEEQFQLTFYIRGWVESVAEWLIGDTDYTKEQLATYLQKLIPPLLMDYL